MTQFCPGIARNDPACPQIVNTFYYGSLWTILGFCVSFLAIQGNLGPWGKLRNILGHFLGEFLQLHWSSNKWTRMLKWLRSSNGTPHGPGKTPGQVENNNYSIHYVDLLFISHYERPCRNTENIYVLYTFWRIYLKTRFCFHFIFAWSTKLH